jgi:hypothetical protein
MLTRGDMLTAEPGEVADVLSEQHISPSAAAAKTSASDLADQHVTHIVLDAIRHAGEAEPVRRGEQPLTSPVAEAKGRT